MKKCKYITCWTDYPFVELGDTPGVKAPIRHVNVYSYDGNKYASVSFPDRGDVLSVKIGYLYSQPGRYGQVKCVNPRKIERMRDGKIARQTDRFKREWARRDRREAEVDRQIYSLMRKEGLDWRAAYGKVKERSRRTPKQIRPLWISVEGGGAFEGHQLHWANCFFSNATKREIERFLVRPGVINNEFPDEVSKYEIRAMTEEELAKYPEAMEFCKELIKEYGEF